MTWAFVRITSSRNPELIGVPRVDVYASDGSGGGLFTEFLTHLVNTTGLPISGAGRRAGPLKQIFEGWAAR